MHNRLIPPPRRHQLLVSLSAHGLQVLHFQRGWLGWKQAHAHRAALPDGDGYLPALQAALGACSQQWRIPATSEIVWVLAGDILGILPPTPTSSEAGPLLPFAASSVLTQTDNFSQGTQKSLLWIHKDWVAEIERISAACALQTVELFARAQLFQPLSLQCKGQVCMVLEGEPAEGHFLHILAADGVLLRSRVLEASSVQDGAALAALLKMELAALPDGVLGSPAQSVQLWASAPVLSALDDSHWPHARRALPTRSLAALLEQLWRSSLEGIVLQATQQHLVQQINFWSVVGGAVGLIGLALMLWHDGQLERQIEQTHEDLRQQAPKVEAAKLLKLKTLWMANAVQAAQAQEAAHQTPLPLPQVLAVLPPPPATLLYLRLDGQKIELAGTGDTAALQWLQERPLPDYQPFTELPVPEFLAERSDIGIHLQTEKLPPAPASAKPEASSEASNAPEKAPKP